MSVQGTTTFDLTEAISKALDARFPEPEWLVARQVPCGTRMVDAIVCRMWADAVLHGIEIKAARSDWLREMANPHKADVAMPFVDYFHLAVADPKICKLEEVPEHWGLLVLQSNGRLRAAKAAPLLRPHIEGRAFWAAMIRRAWQGADERDIEKRVSQARDAGYEQGLKYGRQNERDKIQREDGELESVRKLRDAFGWNTSILTVKAPEIKIWLERERTGTRIRNLAPQLRSLADEIEAAL